MESEEPKSDNDQLAIGRDEAADSQIPLVQHLEEVSLEEVQRQLKTFSLLQLATVNRSFSSILPDQGKEVEIRLSLLLNNSYAVDIQDGSGAKLHHKIDHRKLSAFLKNVFQRLKQLREITTGNHIADHGYYALLKALTVHQVKVYRLYLRDEAMTLVKAKWALLSHCAPNLHTLGLWQSASDVPRCGVDERPYESYEAEYASDKIEAFEKCAKLRRFRLVGWLTPTTIECIGQLKQLRQLDLDGALPSDATFGAFLNVLALNDKLRHLIISFDWQPFLANSHAVELFCQLKSFGFCIDVDGGCSLKHFTAITLTHARMKAGMDPPPPPIGNFFTLVLQKIVNHPKAKKGQKNYLKGHKLTKPEQERWNREITAEFHAESDADPLMHVIDNAERKFDLILDDPDPPPLFPFKKPLNVIATFKVENPMIPHSFRKPDESFERVSVNRRTKIHFRYGATWAEQ